MQFDELHYKGDVEWGVSFIVYADIKSDPNNNQYISGRFIFTKETEGLRIQGNILNLSDGQHDFDIYINESVSVTCYHSVDHLNLNNYSNDTSAGLDGITQMKADLGFLSTKYKNYYN